jgi:nucleoside 2-deoxyribosyltransferase
MNYLKNKRAYLSGAIEFGGEYNWRNEPIKTLTEKFEINIFDPFSDPKGQWTSELKETRENKDYNRLAEIAKSFARRDLCMVDRSDFLIAYMPYKVPTTGTIHEIIVSSNAKKPTLIVCPEGKEYAPAWLWGILPKDSFFGSWNELYSYLQDVTDGKHASNNRWHFCYGLI